MQLAALLPSLGPSRNSYPVRATDRARVRSWRCHAVDAPVQSQGLRGERPPRVAGEEGDGTEVLGSSELYSLYKTLYI